MKEIVYLYASFIEYMNACFDSLVTYIFAISLIDFKSQKQKPEKQWLETVYCMWQTLFLIKTNVYAVHNYIQ